ncbi:MAG: aldo/keto reductase family oxidoreductase [Candidatus Methylacidiphilales bacterium]|nr:aldo/keto reductase [Candidatus Methylacidiphilales bacterium]
MMPSNFTFGYGDDFAHVSPLAYGCMRLAPWERSEATPDTERNGIAVLEAAYEAGYTIFDHADIYGDTMCETIFGKALEQHPEWRDNIFVATKCGIRWAHEPAQTAPFRYELSYGHIKRSVEESLKRLNVGRIDLLQLHRPDPLMHPENVARAFTELRTEGKVRFFGVSNFLHTRVEALRHALPIDMPLIVNQIEFHLNRLDPLENGQLDHALERKYAILAWSPLDRGRLCDGYVPPSEDSTAFSKSTRVLHALDVEAKELGVSRTEVALAWLMRHPARIMPIVGSTTPANIQTAANAASLKLSREAWYRLLEASRGERVP